MNISFKIWRQSSSDKGSFHTYKMDGISEDLSLFEVLDLLNEKLTLKNESVIAFDHDCREGICGQCGIYINGVAHGPHNNRTSCQVYMRSFKDGDEITLEPWRATAFPIVKDLVVDRSAFDRIIESGAYISNKTGSACEANSILISKEDADESMSSAACLGCGACVAACKNASASLFTSAKLNHLNTLEQGKLEASKRVASMTEAMVKEGFGHCSFTGDCEAVCPEKIELRNISKMNASVLKEKALLNWAKVESCKNDSTLQYNFSPIHLAF